MSQIRKRPRPVVSCLRCREKKLKCDRVAPCENCIKASCRADCTYNNLPAISDSLPNPKRRQLSPVGHDERASPAPAPIAGLGIIEDLQQRVGQLEELLAVRSHGNSSASHASVQIASNHASSQSPDPFLGTLVVKGSRCRYHGQNDRISLLNQFPDTKAFINQCAKDRSFVELAKEIQFLQSKSQLPATSPESLSDMETFPELQHLLEFLPSKKWCDHLVEVYQRHFEKTLRIVHIPSFLRQYAAFWNRLDYDLVALSSFVPLLTVVLTLSVVFTPESPASDQVSTWDYLHNKAIGSVQAWLAKLPRKQRVELATLQVETLLTLSRQLRSESPEELWKSTGSLVRSAMSMGLHVSSTQAGKMSPFQAETRRRLWATIMELDLQASLASGMPVMTPDLDMALLMPANLNDCDFDEHTVELPSSKPVQETTDSPMQIILAKSLAQRIKATNLTQHASDNKNIRERLTQGRDLERILSQVPTGFNPLQTLDNGDPACFLNYVLLDLFLRRPLLRLYRPILTAQHSNDPAFNHVQRVFVESSSTILSYQDALGPSLSHVNEWWSTAYWDVFQELFCNDILFAALGVCEHMRLSSQLSREPSSPMDNSSTAARPKSIHDKSPSRLVEDALETMTRPVGTKVANIKDILLLTLAFHSSRDHGSTEQKNRWMFQSAKKAMSAYREHLRAAVDRSFPFTLNYCPQINGSVIPVPESNQQQFEPPEIPTLPDLLPPSSALAVEFENFQSDLFSFDDGSFMWNL